MKIIQRDFVSDGPGGVKMIAEESDDLWIVYNLIAEGDSILALTDRKVLINNKPVRVGLKLEILAETMEFDKEGSTLRVGGQNVIENEYVNVGASHTLELVLHRPFVLKKNVWDSMALQVLEQASGPSASGANLGVILMQEGLAQIFLVGNGVTISRSRIEVSIPRKHDPAIACYDTAMNKFFDKVLHAFVNNIDFKVVQCAVIASPGFTKDQFHRHLLLEAEKKQLRTVIENQSRIVLVRTTSGYKHSLNEVLGAPNVMTMIKDTKVAKEVQALKEFFSMLSNDPNRTCYGPDHVELAHYLRAVKTLLITDELFRNSDVETRQNYANLVKSIRDFGGTTYIFSSNHVSGEQLAQMTGIAAILRFPLPDLEHLEM